MLVLLAAVVQMIALPPHPAPPSPFPTILTDAQTSSYVAPGISYAQYAIQTSEGPLEIHVVAINPRESSVRIDTVLAHDSIISAGETPSAMAVRTGAIAGINGDYFDIGNTNMPLGIVVHAGAMLHSPNKHSAFALTKDKNAVIAPFAFAGAGNVQTIPVALSAINDYPQRTGAALLTPAFGSIAPAAGYTVATLTPLDGPGEVFGRYRIAAIAAPDQPLSPQYAIAFAPDAAQVVGMPAIGDVVTITDASTPAFGQFIAAIGGGPVLLRDGARATENDAPAAAEGRSRIPASAIGIRRDGTLLLFEVDGRQPLHSIGLTRDEQTSFLMALGARDAVALDGGGSSVLVSRRLGDRDATVQSSPSDGTERPVANGLFVYSDAPRGEPAILVVRPNFVRVLTGADVPLEDLATDSAGHAVNAPSAPARFHATPAALGRIDGHTFIAQSHPGVGIIHEDRGSLFADIPVHVLDTVSRIVLLPSRLNLRAGERAHFSVQAYDADGYPVILPKHLAWSATSGHITDEGTFSAADRNAVISVRIGKAIAQRTVTVGEHDEPFMVGTDWQFVSTPKDNPGSVLLGVPCPVCIELAYDFTAEERAASMVGKRALPEDAIGLRIDVNGDGRNELLRIALTNAINERVLLSVGRVNWTGWQTKEVRFPDSLAVPATLHSIYVVKAAGTAENAAGTVAIRNVRAILGGTSTGTPTLPTK